MIYLNDHDRETQQQRRSRQRPANSLQLGLVGFLAGIAVMGGFWWVNSGPQQTLSLYWLTSPDNDIYYVEQERSFRAPSLEQALTQALQQLIAGSSESRLISAIPPETKVLNVKVEGDDIFINFSAAFTQGGGSTTMLGRVTQVLYTATSHDENARVWISVEGEALATLGGEGLILDQPLTRESFKPSFNNRVIFDGVAEWDIYAQQTAEATPPKP